MSIKGGLKVKKTKEETNNLQETINKKLYELIHMEDFLEEVLDMFKPNTYGVMCPNCKTKDNIYAETVQTRSSDEASDRFMRCLTCGYQWKVSGSH